MKFNYQAVLRFTLRLKPCHGFHRVATGTRHTRTRTRNVSHGGKYLPSSQTHGPFLVWNFCQNRWHSYLNAKKNAFAYTGSQMNDQHEDSRLSYVWSLQSWYTHKILRSWNTSFNTLRAQPDDHHAANCIFKYILLKENVVSDFVAVYHKGSIDMSALVKAMFRTNWRRVIDEPVHRRCWRRARVINSPWLRYISIAQQIETNKKLNRFLQLVIPLGTSFIT